MGQSEQWECPTCQYVHVTLAGKKALASGLVALVALSLAIPNAAATPIFPGQPAVPGVQGVQGVQGVPAVLGARESGHWAALQA